MDDIRTFLPGIGEEEYAIRAKMRSYRNAASGMIRATQSDTARQLAWIASDYITLWIYSPAIEVELEDLNTFFRRLLVTAIQAERIDMEGPRT
ncbi:hypothetical protein [Altererythrobacter sp. GH1-8]|uniref:hypothetical protein n=1 Tax=Altererythrobacter sp. GH1-8 TaxID=3349333 RepID=UPI00374C89C4